MNFTPNDSPEKNCLKVSWLPLLCTSNPLKMNSSPIWLPAVFKPNSPIQHVQIVSVSSSLHWLVKLDRDFGAQSLTRVCHGELEQCSLLWTPPCSYIYEWLGLGGKVAEQWCHTEGLIFIREGVMVAAARAVYSQALGLGTESGERSCWSFCAWESEDRLPPAPDLWSADIYAGEQQELLFKMVS